MNIFGERLKELRLEKNLSIKALARELSVSDIAIGRWERGEHLPNIDYLKMIAIYFKVSADFLIGLRDD